MATPNKRANEDSQPPPKKVKYAMRLSFWSADAHADERHRVDYGKAHMIEVLVGPHQTSLAAHQSVLSASSAYFASACSARWEEGREGVVKLPEVDSEAFQVFLHWAYRREIDLSYITEPEPQAGVSFHSPSYLTLGKIWSLGH